ncbi:hypothetical protein [Methylomonas albis]|uniref:Uncharacterized protein n=1 Tax=Methylomonas albis TaxID=1854563 RepID=A0ABR9D302_9GAMM|nr:hypothetical protein [Methylomonas albis]MBD9357492.1 hypothetical protein [Methylomonas albis]
MPNFREYPHAEPCPCCGGDVRWASDEWKPLVFTKVMECLRCGWYEETVVDQNGWCDGEDFGDDDYGDDDDGDED